MSNNPHLDRALARGCFDSITYMTGHPPTSRKPRMFAWVGSWAVGLAVLVAVIALMTKGLT